MDIDEINRLQAQIDALQAQVESMRAEAEPERASRRGMLKLAAGAAAGAVAGGMMLGANPALAGSTNETQDIMYYTTTPTRVYGGKLTENICQALARIAIGEQMLLISKKYQIVMTVHDAIACIVPEDEAERAQEFVEMCMRIRPKWAPELPLNCEAGWGRSYAEC